jgi:toxin ParE1/3/4
MRRAAANPGGTATRDRRDILPGIRSLHLRHVRAESADTIVAKPLHVLYYRVVEPDVIEIVRVLHERMEPSLYIG